MGVSYLIFPKFTKICFFVHTACMCCLSRIRLVDNNQIHAFLHYWNMTTLRKKLRKNNSKRNVIKLRAAQNKFVKYRLHREIILKNQIKLTKLSMLPAIRVVGQCLRIYFARSHLFDCYWQPFSVFAITFTKIFQICLQYFTMFSKYDFPTVVHWHSRFLTTQLQVKRWL